MLLIVCLNTAILEWELEYNKSKTVGQIMQVSKDRLILSLKKILIE